VVDEDTLSSVLSEFARTLITDFPIQGILDHLVERIVDVMSVTGAGVTLIWPGTAPRYVAASNRAALGFERLQTELGQGPCLAAYETGHAVSVPDLRLDRRFPEFSSAALTEGLRGVFAFPLRHANGRLGALDLYRDGPGALAPRDLAAAQTLADVAAAYLLNARARHEALEVSDRFRLSALHDALTGLPNRVLLQQRLEHAAQRAHRSHSPAAVLFADLDRFKWVNDTYGHPVGDELLIAVAARLSGLVRPGDTLARVSGDEFVILCEDLGHVDDAISLARRLDEAFAVPFCLADTELRVTLSVGIAYSGPGEAVTDQLITHADLAMYQAKRRGGATHHVIDLGRGHSRGGASTGTTTSARRWATGTSTWPTSRSSASRTRDSSGWRRCCAGPRREPARCPRRPPSASQNGTAPSTPSARGCWSAAAPTGPAGSPSTPAAHWTCR
jgi:diguanylate cyclase (GGDEF)-like protein